MTIAHTQHYLFRGTCYTSLLLFGLSLLMCAGSFFLEGKIGLTLHGDRYSMLFRRELTFIEERGPIVGWQRFHFESSCWRYQYPGGASSIFTEKPAAYDFALDGF